MPKREQNVLEGYDFLLALDPGVNMGYAAVDLKTKELVLSGTLRWTHVKQLIAIFTTIKSKLDGKVLVVTEDCYANQKNSVQASLTFGKRIALVSAIGTIILEGKDNLVLRAVSPGKWVSALHLGGSTKVQRVAKVKEVLGISRKISEHEADAILLAYGCIKNNSLLGELKY